MEFTDCLTCGKRVATTARICHHCKTERSSAPSTLPKSKHTHSSQQSRAVEEIEEEEYLEGSHATLGLGGYDDYGVDEEDSDNKPSRQQSMWRWVAWVLLVLFTLGALVPFLF